MCHDNEEWYKNWRGTELSFWKWHEPQLQNLTRPLKKSKNSFLIGSLWPKHILFELQKYRGAIFHDTEELCKFWRKTGQWFKKRHEKFGKFLPEHLKVSKLKGILLFKVEKVWIKIYRGVMCHDNEE